MTTAEPAEPLDLPLLPQGSLALEVALAWLANLPADPMGRAAERDLQQHPPPAASLRGRLLAAGLDVWADHLVWAPGDNCDGEILPRPGRQLLGQAGVELAVAGEHPRLFALVDELWRLGDGLTRRQGDEIVARLRSSGAEHPLLSVLGDRLDAAARRESRSVQAPEIRPAPDLRRLWSGSREAFFWDHWACQVCARVWPGPFMTRLSLAPSAYAHAAAAAALPLSLDELIALLSDAPDAFDASGGPTGAVAIFALLEAVHEDREDGGLRPLTHAPRNADLDRIIDAVLARPDGEAVGRAWAQRIVWTTRGGGLRGREIGLKPPVMHILNELSSGLRPISQAPHAWIEAEDDLWRVDRVLVEAMVLHHHAAPGEAADLLAEAVVRGSVTATGRTRGLLSSSAEAAIVGGAIAAHPDPAAWFSRLWAETWDARERGRFAKRRSAENPACSVLAWGVQGLNHLGGKTGQAALWAELFKAITETRFTDPAADLPYNDLGPITRTAGRVCAHLVDTGLLPTAALGDLIAAATAPSEAFGLLMAEVSDSTPSPGLLTACRLAGRTKVIAALKACLQVDPGATRPTELDTESRAKLEHLVTQI